MPSIDQQRGLSLILVFLAVTFILFSTRSPEDGKSIASSSIFSGKGIRHLPIDPAGIKVPVPFGRRDDSIHVNHVVPRSEKEGNANKIGKRALTFEQAVIIGEDYEKELSEERTQSPRSTTDQLVEKGWEIKSGGEEPDYYADIYGHLGGDIKHSDAIQLEAVQDKAYSNCRFENLPGTNGFFLNKYNVPGRTIVGVSNFSPAFFLREKQVSNLKEKLPDVYSWSDVVWVNWSKLAGGSTGSLKYIFKHNVETEDTVVVIKHLAGVTSNSGSGSNAGSGPDSGSVSKSDADPGSDPGSDSGSESGSDPGSDPMSEDEPDSEPVQPLPWPGLTFPKGTQGYQALLGTPHGKGIVWMIVGHPNEMPGKDLESITMFTTDKEEGDAVYNLLFTLSG